MSKVKFTLTSDLVKVEPETPYQPLPVQIEQVNEISSTQGEPIDQINIRGPKSLKKEFKIWCLQNNKSMTEAFILAFDFLKENYKDS